MNRLQFKINSQSKMKLIINHLRTLLWHNGNTIFIYTKAVISKLSQIVE